MLGVRDVECAESLSAVLTIDVVRPGGVACGPVADPGVFQGESGVPYDAGRAGVTDGGELRIEREQLVCFLGVLIRSGLGSAGAASLSTDPWMRSSSPPTVSRYSTG
jgi:hypothetical protein